MAYDDYECLKLVRDGKILTATIDSPPINVMTLPLFQELSRLSEELSEDQGALVFILKSADPDFFIAHFDVSALLQAPRDRPFAREDADSNPFYAMCGRFASMDVVTIAQIEGRVGGGGSELSMAFDMRFGVKGKTIINQMEVPLGILPGGSGTQRMPRLIGRARAMEIILGGVDLDGETAERWGYLNRCLPASEIGSYVDGLAKRIASFPEKAVRLAKQAVHASAAPLDQGLREESYHFQTLMRTQESHEAMSRFLKIGGQTREGELDVEQLAGRLLG